MKKIVQCIALLAGVFIHTLSFAQVSVTSSTGIGNSPYTTLKAAFDDINAGVLTGTISISITDSTIETATATLNASGSGLASYGSVYIAPVGGPYMIKGAMTAGSPLIDFNGADNVVINGLYNGVVSLTFMNTTVSSTAGTSTIRFINDASNDSLVYCNIRGASVSNVNGTVMVSTTNGANGNDQIVIDHCAIFDATTGTPQHGVQAVGSTTTASTYNDNCVVSNCSIYNFFATGSGGTRGVNIGVGNNGWIVSNNSFYQTATRTGLTSVFQFLSVAPTNNTTGFTVVGNYFGGTQPMLGGAPMTVSGTSTSAELRSVIFVTTLGVVNSFQGNAFGNMTITVGYNSTTNVECLVQSNTSTIEMGNVSPNFFGDSTGQTSINISVGSNAIFSVLALGHGGPTNAVVQNNSISGIRLMQGASLRGIQIGNSTGGQNFAMNTYVANNTIGSVGGQSALSTVGSASITCIFYNLGAAATTLQTVIGNTIATIRGGTGNISVINSSVNTANYSIKNNTLFNITNSSTSTSNTIVGILYSSTVPGDTVTGNKIFNLTSLATTGATTVKGIVFSCATTGVNLLANNAVSTLHLKTSSVGVIQGLYITGGLYTVANNMVSLGYDSVGTSIKTMYDIRGIYPTAATNGSGFYYNSVLIGGDSVSGNTTSTYALFSGITTSATVGITLQNNVWYNKRTFLTSPTGTARNFAAYFIGSLSSGALTGLTSSYNFYSDSLTNLTGAAVLTSVGSVRYPYLTDWKTTSTHDIGSISGDPLFTAYNNLAPQSSSPLFFAGIPVTSVTTDFNGITRSVSAPTMGAGETTLALPVTYLYFKGEVKGSSHLLTWATASEVNNKAFVLEQSKDGKNFTELATLSGRGTTTTPQNYRFLNRNVSAEFTYYRLVQVDMDGEKSYSNLVVLHRSKLPMLTNLSAAPNPFTDVTTLSVNTEKQQQATLSIYTIDGKMVYHQTYQLVEGRNEIVVRAGDISSPACLLWVKLYTDESTQTIKLIKIP